MQMTSEACLSKPAENARLRLGDGGASGDHAKEYLRKHQQAPLQIGEAPSLKLRLVVVIPCRDEPDLLTTLKDLRRCRDPGCAVEIIAVLNASERDPEEVRARNRATRREITAWLETRSGDPCFRVHAIEFDALPHRHAGVGLARKLGMDEAVARLAASGAGDGIIAALDADCRVDESYLAAIVEHFDAHADSPACSIYFEHSLTGDLSEAHYAAITDYELYLRYYRQGLAYAVHPCAHYTVGSCMAVRADAYSRQGGMNRRKGAEDFYFLNKLMLLGNFTEVRTTTVMPSARVSHRVPFGTGRAVRDALENPCASLEVYAPRVFDDLAALVSRVDGLREAPPAVMDELPRVMGEFLIKQGVDDKINEIRGNTATKASFRRRFFRWFDGFQALKFVRYASEHAYPRVAVRTAALELLRRQAMISEQSEPRLGAAALLEHYRLMDRQGRRMAPAA
jgi:hypothetical protein